MQPKLFAATNILARLLIQFATRQGNSYVSVISSGGTFKDKRFARFLSRYIPTRTIARPITDKQKLPKSQVESHTQLQPLCQKISRSSLFRCFSTHLLQTAPHSNTEICDHLTLGSFLLHVCLFIGTSNLGLTPMSFLTVWLMQMAHSLSTNYTRSCQRRLFCVSVVIPSLNRSLKMISSQQDIHPILMGKIWYQRARISCPPGT